MTSNQLEKSNAEFALATLPEIQRLAKAGVSPGAWDWLESGSEREWTLHANIEAFRRHVPIQRIFRDVSQVSTRRNFLGVDLPFPLIGAPLGGLTQYHPDGEIALVAGCHLAHSVSALSAAARLPPEDARKAAPDAPLIYQLYFQGPDEWIVSEIERAHALGVVAISLCGDSAVRSIRYRDRENRYDARKFGRTENKRPPDHALGARADWKLMRWIRSLTDKPLLVKGVMCADDALASVDNGADGLWVSNHGGRVLDAGMASLEVLPEIRAAVGTKTLVLFDGGVRTGTDMLRALALGADIVAIGRPLVYGLTVAGPEGVRRVFEMFGEEFHSAMAFCGLTSLDEINPGVLRRAPVHAPA